MFFIFKVLFLISALFTGQIRSAPHKKKNIEKELKEIENLQDEMMNDLIAKFTKKIKIHLDFLNTQKENKNFEKTKMKEIILKKIFLKDFLEFYEENSRKINEKIFYLYENFKKGNIKLTKNTKYQPTETKYFDIFYYLNFLECLIEMKGKEEFKNVENIRSILYNGQEEEREEFFHCLFQIRLRNSFYFDTIIKKEGNSLIYKRFKRKFENLIEEDDYLNFCKISNKDDPYLFKEEEGDTEKNTILNEYIFPVLRYDTKKYFLSNHLARKFRFICYAKKENPFLFMVKEINTTLYFENL